MNIFAYVGLIFEEVTREEANTTGQGMWRWRVAFWSSISSQTSFGKVLGFFWRNLRSVTQHNLVVLLQILA